MKSLTKGLVNLLLISTAITVLSNCSDQPKKEKTGKRKGSDTILIQSMQFSPASITVRSGDTITWINRDLVDHNVRDTLNHLFYSDTLKKGSSYRWIVKWEAKYICTIHPTMAGKIQIRD